MSKELEALEKVKKATYFVDFEVNASVGEDYKEEITIIEKALEEKDQQDSVLKTLKEVIEFGQMSPYIEPNKDNGFDIMSAVRINIQRDIENKERELLRNWILETCFPKELKALEIIKKKKVDMVILDRAIHVEGSHHYYNKEIEKHLWIYEDKLLTKEDFDILKEVLK